jgi:ABC-type cobalt transport system substrate-binding protein
VTTEGLKSWIIIMAVLVLALIYLSVTGNGTVGGSFSVASLISGGLLVLAAYNWGGWKRS